MASLKGHGLLAYCALMDLYTSAEAAQHKPRCTPRPHRYSPVSPPHETEPDPRRQCMVRRVAVLVIESRVDVAGTDFMVACTDEQDQSWWPGTHLQLHVPGGTTGEVGDVMVMDEFIAVFHAPLHHGPGCPRAQGIPVVERPSPAEPAPGRYVRPSDPHGADDCSSRTLPNRAARPS